MNGKYYAAGDPEPLPATEKPIQPGQPAPPLQVAGWTDGRSRSLEEFRGKVVVIDFWATWCGGCVRIIPEMKKLEDQYKGKGVVFLAIHTAGADLKQILAFQREKKWTVAMAVDGGVYGFGGYTHAKYGVAGIPSFIVIGRDGRVAWNPEANFSSDMMEKAAKHLSIPWPLNEKAPQEQIDRAEQRISEYLIHEAIDQTLGRP